MRPILGTGFLAVGHALLATMGTGTSRILTCGYLLLVGTGLGLTQQTAGTIAQNSVDMRDMGAAMSAVTLFRTLGGSLGAAVFGSLFAHAVRSPLSGTGGAETDGHSLDHPPAGAEGDYLNAVTHGTHQIFLTGAILCAAAFVAALYVVETPLRAARSTGTRETTVAGGPPAATS